MPSAICTFLPLHADPLALVTAFEGDLEAWLSESRRDGAAALTDRLLLSFDGELGLHLGEPGRTTLVLDGRYQPPGGSIGTAVDTIALHRLARLTTSLVSTTATRFSAEARAAQTSRLNPPD